jgi:transmembrane sensor
MGPDPQIIKEAAKWLVQFESGPIGVRDKTNFERWMHQSEAHQQAWRLASQLSSKLNTLPVGLLDIKSDLHEANRRIRSRRETLRMLSVAGLSVCGAAWVATDVPWKTMLAEHQTDVGVLRRLSMPVQVELVLNTKTAVDIDSYNQEVWLRDGQLLVNTTAAVRGRSSQVSVQTRMGVTQVANGRAAIWIRPDSLRVAALQGEVRLLPMQGGAGGRTIPAGRAALLHHRGDVELVSGSLNDEIWTQGLIFAQDMPLPAFVQELSRYHAGLLKCSPELQNVTISGIYRYADLNGILQLLVNNYPVDIRKLSTYWVSIMPRSVSKTT